MKNKILKKYKKIKIKTNKILKKIKGIFNEYQKDFFKYYTVVRKKSKKIYRKSKYYFFKLKEDILRQENRKKYLTTTGILIVINLLIINIYASFGYYYDTDSLSLLRTVVGNMYMDKYDYVLLVYLEDTDSTGNGNGKYHLSESVPSIGYNYSGYKCQNDSALVFDKETKIASVNLIQKEICSIYFDAIGKMDLSVKIMLEKEINSNEYTLTDKIPSFGYKYSHYECASNSLLEYNSELHKIKLSSTTQEYCSMYFKKESSDITVNLYIEQNYQTKDYITRQSIPTNTIYVLNEEKSICKKNNNERINTPITYEEGYINIETSEMVNCDIYLDKNEE